MTNYRAVYFVCTFSSGVSKILRGFEMSPVREFLKAGIPVSVGTDNRTVSRVSLTPVASDPAAEIRVNGTLIRSGSTSSYIRMDDKPQQVLIDVSNSHGTTRYTLFLQRRPSEKRTRVSAGQVNAIYFSGSGWVIDADLGTVTYSDGNLSTYINKTPESYKYAAAPNCIFYYGDIAAPVRAFSAQALSASSFPA